jgi:hypothetical protein
MLDERGYYKNLTSRLIKTMQLNAFDISGFSHNEFAYLLGCYGLKFTLIEGHYQTFESFPSRSAPKKRQREKKAS